MVNEAIFRSAPMCLCQIVVASEVSREIIASLGERDLIQFTDLNADSTAFNRTFVKEIRRLDEITRQLNYFKKCMSKVKIKPKKIPDHVNVSAAPHASEIDELANRANDLEERISQLMESNETLLSKQSELFEIRHVLITAGEIFDQAYSVPIELRMSVDNADNAPLLIHDLESGEPSRSQTISNANISFVAGVIARDKLGTLERILWRSLRGNMLIRNSDIEASIKDPKSGEDVPKSVFVVFAHGAGILAKVQKLAESLEANIHAVNEDLVIRRDQIREVNGAIDDVEDVVAHTELTLRTELEEISNHIESWLIIAQKERAIYAALNMFSYDPTRKILIAEGWVPTDQLSELRQSLTEVTETSGLDAPCVLNELQTTRTPPTYYRTNKFTETFQTIIDAYGISQYQEVNPGLPAIVTFPFMFAIMFGDLGHGAIMFLAGVALIAYEQKIGKIANRDEMFDMIFTGRYVILMMGVFAMYTGLIYNDIFSKSMTLFRPGWQWPQTWNEGDLILANQTGVYPFGLDPTWHGSENSLIFGNSYKMKLSILIGFIHMLYSLFFSLINFRFYGQKIDIYGNFIPGLLFLVSIFGYLAFMIVFKWTVDWYAIDKPPPGLLNTLIDMFLSPGTVQDLLFPGQAALQVILVLLAIACVPWLLFLKPMYLRRKHKKQSVSHGYSSIASEQENTRLSIESASSIIVQEMEVEEPFDFGDIMIHQVIFTIEFCMACVSHTASYLRLWALSLAHAQLSTVLWSMTFQPALNVKSAGPGGMLASVLLFGAWFSLTVFILVIMEGTSAMLHSLRLHWVEAMSKHFIGDGTQFTPFSFGEVVSSSGG
ncbi:V-type ATPase, V0 complex, 116kDa subunit family [Lipomyces japonicus]|uniref:V-type ATPase, V0 complex, 116kDa subunit family n=1 Tax=Lipomyces japonicus TaxID=56871 RepID=UPI0034CD8364